MARSGVVLAALLVVAFCAGVTQAHEVEGCSFPANVSSRANLTVAGQALDALGGSDLFGSHGTVFLPTDAAFQALLTALDVTPAQLLGDDLQNTTVAILAYHYLPDEKYTQAQLIGNRTVETGLAELASEMGGANMSYPLRFSRQSGQLRIQGVNNTAIVVDDLGDVCNRQVYTIDTVLIPEDDISDIPQTIPEAVALRSAAEEAGEPAAADSDGGETAAAATAPAPAPQGAQPAAASTALLAAGVLGASLLLTAL